MSETRTQAAQWHERYQALIDQGQPEGCVRRRMKPYIDDCECEWCRELDEMLMSRPSNEPDDV